ncbi:hypothetical protein [Butyricimonas sp. Marseille-P3923]|uniref:hypothetical protein n=1 Tax=Butyricimonas sp. Marseille-P3923 TaxID=1987504 RepID=UPI000C082FC6|nr:hypothetical protein [Butyricimonas sp. Marseille-P3923]
MKILNYLLLGVALCFAACNDDDENLSPTGETNWFVLEDSDDELGHLAYEIYKETGVTIFYNDTIAKVQRGVNSLGEPMYRYEVLGINYNVNSHYNYRYPLLTERDKIKKGMEFLRDEVIPGLLNGASPCSFLLVDSLINKSNVNENTLYLKDVFKARRTTCVALYEKKETEIDKKSLGATVLAEEYAAYMNGMESDNLTVFCSFSVGKVDKVMNKPLYGVSMKETNKDTDWDEDCRKFGFLSYDKGKKFTVNKKTGKLTEYTCPTVIQDIADYVKEVLLGDDAAFEEKNGEFKLCVEKYKLMKSIVSELQETLGKRSDL